ncbi:hypothetical protein UFOVP1017_17 [uncultured Caudovirales phage]|uniref:PD-(D/E)XK endonuclease-like domain-containing protein n=1 Tax=uncultured Caudovirales phage TaxID=2100421 RepID=A0A6J5SVR6_9CAUD|nr:hypothetical protein UFOVP511_17 [uncultured Caudovirales phage]CAB4178500.1 hypothetical protein UFOVP1017_17 [uncultured Caudovirales phage]CAB4187858.1 hypothetical protein UFOVP1168_17 [uncultured Caudovirales phage]CAB4219603.1 hypothetical protein UFOVP1617_36 [uncultured Caudovirales phage]
MGRVVFDAEAHTYTWQGRVIPSVTSRIAAAGLLGAGAQFYTPASAARGTRVHLACAEYDHGRATTLPDTESGYLDSYTFWHQMMAPKWSHIEQPQYSVTHDTAGTADRVGVMNGHPLIVDLKTGSPASWHGLQLAMYDLLYDDVPPQQRRRLALYLRKDGRLAQSVEYLDPADYALALNLMKRTDTNGIDRTRAERHVDPQPQTQSGTVEPDDRAGQSR